MRNVPGGLVPQDARELALNLVLHNHKSIYMVCQMKKSKFAVVRNM